MAYEILEEFEQPTQQESLGGNLLKQGVRTGVRVGEQVLGTPGELASALGSLGQLTPEYQQQPMQDLRGKSISEIMEAIQPSMRQGTPSQVFRRQTESLQDVRPPTPQEIKQKYTKPFEEKYLPENYLSSQNSWEEFGDRLVQDITALANPLFGLIGGTPMNVKRAFKIAGLGNVGQWASDSIGLPKWTGKTIKTGIILGGTLLGQKGLNERTEDVYNSFDESIKGGEAINNAPVKQANKDLLKYWKTGSQKVPGKEIVKSITDEIYDLTEGPVTDIKSLWEYKKDLNKIVSDLYNKGKYGPANALEEVSKAISKTIYNDPGHKEVGKLLKRADEMYRGVLKSNKINKFVTNTIKDNKALQIGGLASAIWNPVKTAKTAAAALVPFGGAHAANIISQFNNNPALRKEYIDIVRAAARESAPAVIKNLHDFNKAAEKSKKRFEILEYS